MKMMTCRELGGACDKQLLASSWKALVKATNNDVMKKHADTARSMQKMHEDGPENWGREMRPKWDAKAVV